MKKKIRKDWLERPSSKSPYLQENSWKSKKKDEITIINALANGPINDWFL